MKTWMWWIVWSFIGLGVWVLWQDATERVKQAQAAAWYATQEQTTESTLRRFKDCVETGERVRNCIGELE